MIRNGELPLDYVLTGDEPPQPKPPKVEPEPVKIVPLAAAPVASPSKPKPKPVKAQVQTPVSVPKPVKPLIPADPDDPTVAKKRSHKKGQGIAAMAAKAAQDGKWIVSLARLLQCFTFARVLTPFHLSLIFSSTARSARPSRTVRCSMGLLLAARSALSGSTRQSLLVSSSS